ncbi:hypothetical protein FEZ18_06310 [Oceanihabitans sp. IOP_32]|uniref:hypothetical protein n=1 Tax=Oceanihabitans sp. IOP_32 TaxID=2529032 RepID=UPI001292DC6D|nr:hypothetical protein [Oceanihabitans sp. IOP_32]QFZ54434.1 hypothetical protein FEZ18_06310 [Oceanihabitans sp. IOP_32]
MKQLVLLIGFVAFFACKSEKKKTQILETEDDTIVVNNEIEGNQYFEVILDAVVKKDDKFHLFYKDFNSKEYSSKRVLEVIVKGSENSQKLVFSIPEGIIPNGLRLDFGVNYSQEPITLNNLKITYNNKEFYFNDGKFEQLFKPNKYIIYNEKDKLITTQPINGSYDPNFVSINIEDIVFSMLD